MARQVISVGNEEHVVREDTAKSYRGVYWALISILAFAAIAAIVFLSGILSSAVDGNMRSPAQIERQAGR